jgi:hypothetical protein
MNYTTTKYFDTVTREYFTYIISTYITDYKYEIMSNILGMSRHTREAVAGPPTRFKNREKTAARGKTKVVCYG